MSGIVGIINLDGAPVNQELLHDMADFLAFRGPDARNTWMSGPVALGHALLRTTTESQREVQPCSLDGRVWITADARLDGRDDLIQKLKPRVRGDFEDVTDVELILHAYQVWGEECVDHLLGDFAFAIWNGAKRRLFCARDHLGVKPFYYACLKNCLVFSNTLNCVRQHPGASGRLNDLAIADFLLFDYNQDPATTSFADIQRLPPAHCLTWSQGAPHLRRYWTLGSDDRIRYKRSSEYVEHFKELFRMAVGDRLRTDRVAIFMSGGLDSSTVAATACKLLSERSGPCDLRAYTAVYDRLIPDEERKYSGLVAQALGIPIHYLVADGYLPYAHWDQAELSGPEPCHNPLQAIGRDRQMQVGAGGRVALTGFGGDPVLYYPCGAYVAGLIKSGHWVRLVREIGECILFRHRLPLVGLRTWFKSRLGKPRWTPPFPKWLNPALSTRLDLLARWENLNKPPARCHTVRPEAYEQVIHPVWPFLFECEDPGVTLVPVHVRHPFFDLRLINYLLAIPPVPWFVEKELLREAMSGELPERVRLRPKTPLAGFPIFEHMKKEDTQWWMDHLTPSPELVEYVDIDAVPQTAASDYYELWVKLRPLSLNYWLRSVESCKRKQRREHNGIPRREEYQNTVSRPPAFHLR